jgi:hypothetical protein
VRSNPNVVTALKTGVHVLEKPVSVAELKALVEE